MAGEHDEHVERAGRTIVRRSAVALAVVALAAGGFWWQAHPGHDASAIAASPGSSPATTARGSAAASTTVRPTATATTATATTSTTTTDPLCGEHAVMPEMSHDASTAGTIRRTSDGRWERVVEGADPHVDTSAFPFTQAPSATQQAAAQRFAGRVRRAAAEHGWNDPRRALADGYSPMQQCGTHWVNTAAAFDHRVLDPDHPEFLVYENHGQGLHLDSVMFTAAANGVHGPQPFGPVSVWHYHDTNGQCMERGILVRSRTPTGCPPGASRYARTIEMLHVMIDPSYGPFAIGM